MVSLSSKPKEPSSLITDVASFCKALVVDGRRNLNIALKIYVDSCILHIALWNLSVMIHGLRYERSLHIINQESITTNGFLEWFRSSFLLGLRCNYLIIQRIKRVAEENVEDMRDGTSDLSLNGKCLLCCAYNPALFSPNNCCNLVIHEVD